VDELLPLDDVLVHHEDGEAFLLHVPSGRYYGLNRTGVVIWEALRAGEDPSAALAARWPDVPADARAADVERLVGALRRAGLLAPPSPTPT